MGPSNRCEECGREILRGYETVHFGETEGEQPLLVVEGKTVTWEEFGRMLSTYEGWQFKIEIYDRSEER